MSIFPAVQPEAENFQIQELPLCREVAWDFDLGIPLFSAGKPLEVTGAEAVKVWIWKALNTVRYRHEIYTWDYGCEVENLIGQAFTPEVKQSEAVRYIREALMVNPYIRSVRQTSVDFKGTRLTVSCTVDTIYGEVDVNV